MDVINVLMFGDITGKPGRRAIKEKLQLLREDLNVDLVIANGENAAGGNGITKEIAEQLFEDGIDILTMGNHVWDKREVFDFIDEEKRILRPANFPPGTPGRGFEIYKDRHGRNVAVICLSGRVFMGSELDCPFRGTEQILNSLPKDIKVILIDFHAEATSEKLALAYDLDGKVSALVGTHTHVQTADEQVLAQGTGYMTDLGMTGPKNSVLGIRPEIIIRKFKTQLPQKFEIENGPFVLNGAFLRINTVTGKCQEIRRISCLEG